VERTWNALGGPAVLTNAQDLADAEAFFHRLEEIDARDATLDLMQLEAQLADLYARPRRSAGKEPHARVEVMTIHKAKGLEFDTVIVPGLERSQGRDGQRLLRLARLPSVAHGLVLAPVKADGATEDSVYRWLQLLDAERAVRERGRLLYVAATRARRDLHLMGRLATRQATDGAELEKPRNGSMLQMLWPAVCGAFAEAFDALAREPAPATPPTAPVLRRLPLDWVRPAADPPVAAASSGAIPYVSLERPDFDWASETSRHVGTLVHRELERLAQIGNDSRWRSAATRPRLRTELAELGIPAERCEAALERVVLAIDKTLADAKGRWLLGLTGALREAHSELRLTGVVDGQLVDGAIDRTFVDERGTRWIVDFKTSSHAGGGLEAFLDNEVARYRPQLARYARLVALLRPEPIKAALYFPLLSVWRDVFPITQLGFVRGKQLDLF
jgi:ATP-dependent exoDNAse (exonuclease V) beta subunit